MNHGRVWISRADRQFDHKPAMDVILQGPLRELSLPISSGKGVCIASSQKFIVGCENEFCPQPERCLIYIKYLDGTLIRWTHAVFKPRMVRCIPWNQYDAPSLMWDYDVCPEDREWISSWHLSRQSVRMQQGNYLRAYRCSWKWSGRCIWRNLRTQRNSLSSAASGPRERQRDRHAHRRMYNIIGNGIFLLIEGL